ncbi:hypothetical protein [Shouchella shacheensis]|uniref:hypothetical protein n=1 Tax=Shouchella shacheensis TaxID=1649580 RepID=UPI00073FB0E1|nr:hypothetical protein [Shouchella shacheensis]
MNNNTAAYDLLFKMHRMLVRHYRVPDESKDSYKLTIAHVLHMYSNRFPPELASDLKKTNYVRNRVCHFSPISNADLLLVEKTASRIKRMTEKSPFKSGLYF